MARQVGTVLGVAALVAILAHVSPEPITTFRHAIVLVIAFFTAAGLVAAILLTGKARSPVPAAAAAATPAQESR
jgi:hypothetical protein